uniref:Phd finger protein alfin-like 1-like n=1 Tax=Tetraselmis sp. GSL018 TaxID=582737 RepID=A0A061R0R7_9CHLO|mmetsp:Transcript_20064/g.47780  ORF Transcript_20064/g.47780 Transcript_20064/m.47780 type:complete len:248 (-) Transcript_20064:482-1225(-)
MQEFPRTVEDIFKDYTGRRSGILMALTEESDDFYAMCDPERDNLCLYGEPDGTWVVDLPTEEVPPETPEPVLGINFARDGMNKQDWLALVAVHSDAWLMAMAFYFAAKLDGNGRSQLYARISELQTLYEVLTDKPKARGNRGAPKKRKRTQQEPEEADMYQEIPGGDTAREAPQAAGRLLTESDIGPWLKGRAAELFWPDDGLWYSVRIASVNARGRSARIIYDGGEVEDLELDEIIREGHMSLLPQ